MVGGVSLVVGPLSLLQPVVVVDDDGSSSSSSNSSDDNTTLPAEGAGKKWVTDFLRKVKAQNAPLDFLSWHSYGACDTDTDDGSNNKDCGKDNPKSVVGMAAFVRVLLDDNGFESIDADVVDGSQL